MHEIAPEWMASALLEVLPMEPERRLRAAVLEEVIR
jgi:hypothetical protein